MTERRSLTTSEHRRHISLPLVRRPVADGVDAAVKAMQAAGAHAGLDRATAQASFGELPAGDRTMLL
jgi:hypothetical protein